MVVFALYTLQLKKGGTSWDVKNIYFQHALFLTVTLLFDFWFWNQFMAYYFKTDFQNTKADYFHLNKGSKYKEVLKGNILWLWLNEVLNKTHIILKR